jgi:choline dehydrogenase
MGDSLLVLERRPWVFLIELVRYLLFGTGMLLAPIVQLAIFASSLLLDAHGMPIKDKSAQRDTLPDLEIIPVSCCT